MTRKEDWVLLAISFAKDGGLSPVQLQKSLFLLGKMFRKEVGKKFYKFIPYNYGPFCQAIYSDSEILAKESLIDIWIPIEKGWSEYSITPKGSEYAEKLKNQVPLKAYQYLCEVVNWVCSITFQQLIRSIYHKFPEYRINSVFQE